MGDFRYPLKTKDPTTETNNRSLMDWLRKNVIDTTEDDGELLTAMKLNDLWDVNADDPLDDEALTWNAGVARWEPSPGIPGPIGQTGATGATGLTGAPGAPGADGIDGTDGVDGSGSRASMLMLGGM
jgi:hypothetical protein